MDPNTAKDPETVQAMIQRKKELMKKMKQPAMAGEGNQFAQAVQKAKAAGMKAGDKFKVGNDEYTLKDAIEMAGLQLEEFFSEEEMEVPAEAQAEAEEIKHEHGVAMVDLVGSEETIHVPSVGGRNNRSVQKQVCLKSLKPVSVRSSNSSPKKLRNQNIAV